MAKDAGYWQAVDNLAFYIRQLADETQVPVFDDHPWLLDEDEDFQVEFCSKFMTEEQQHKWAALDEAFLLITLTYGTTFEETYAEVYMRIWQYDLESGELMI